MCGTAQAAATGGGVGLLIWPVQAMELLIRRAVTGPSDWSRASMQGLTEGRIKSIDF